MNEGIAWLHPRFSVGVVFAVVSAVAIALLVHVSADSASAGVTRTPYITGLNSPRGLKLNAAGNLVIAEQGTGADDGRLLEATDLNDDGDADDKGELTEIATGLPSFLGGDPENPNLAGVSGVAQAADGTYWLVVGGGLLFGRKRA